MRPISRRTALSAPLLAAPLLAAGCRASAEPERAGPLPPLRQVAPFPLGACAMTAELSDPAFAGPLAANFSQLTPEWEMKMEAILKPDGGFDFARGDALADFAARNGMRLHGHTLIWYAQAPEAFARIDGQGSAFASAYRNYILAVAGRYRGRAAGWDVVNEAVAEDGNGYRDCLWRKNLGMDYVAAAFDHAREADPDAILFLNDYNLETNPRKRASFLRLAEGLLKAGAPLGGLGSQSHVSIDLKPGAFRTAIRELASLGLPIHVSELDVSIRREGPPGRLDPTPTAERLARQARVYGEAVEAFMALPPGQRYAVTVWGLRDRDSWLRDPKSGGGADDKPLLFDDQGHAKPAARALVRAFAA